MKREPKECWINQYNTYILDGWDANIDIQYVVDAYSCISYILSYISKKESEEGQLLKTAQKEAREGNNEAVKLVSYLVCLTSTPTLQGHTGTIISLTYQFDLAWRWPFINVSKVLLRATGDAMTRDRHYSDHPSHYVSP